MVYPQRCVKGIVLLVVEAFNTDPDKTPVVYFATLPLPRPSPAILTPRLCHSHPSPSKVHGQCAGTGVGRWGQEPPGHNLLVHVDGGGRGNELPPSGREAGAAQCCGLLVRVERCAGKGKGDSVLQHGRRWGARLLQPARRVPRSFGHQVGSEQVALEQAAMVDSTFYLIS